ncbi:MAG: hypothetical protein HN607_01470 [Verrucomicrobia bacterium]|nr:hypothetical protein [Verrucomicrobiota bacterium]
MNPSISYNPLPPIMPILSMSESHYTTEPKKLNKINNINKKNTLLNKYGTVNILKNQVSLVGQLSVLVKTQ